MFVVGDCGVLIGNYVVIIHAGFIRKFKIYSLLSAEINLIADEFSVLIVNFILTDRFRILVTDAHFGVKVIKEVLIAIVARHGLAVTVGADVLFSLFMKTN